MKINFRILGMITLLLASGCSQKACYGYQNGDLGEKCKEDGTCNSTNLECSFYGDKCLMKQVPTPPKSCRYESECFCKTCNETCSAYANGSMKRCAYSDTTVWGNGPAICECSNSQKQNPSTQIEKDTNAH